MKKILSVVAVLLLTACAHGFGGAPTSGGMNMPCCEKCQCKCCKQGCKMGTEKTGDGQMPEKCPMKNMAP